jgi:hypothetical protein
MTMKWTKSDLTAYTPHHPGTALVLQGEASGDGRWFVARMGSDTRPSWGVSCPATGARIASFDCKWHARAFCAEMGRRLDARKPQTVYDYVCAELSASRMSTISRKAAELDKAGVANALQEYRAYSLERSPAPAWLTR